MRNVVIGVVALLTVGLASIMWSRSSLLSAVGRLEARLTEVDSGFEPVHERCELFAGQLAESAEALDALRIRSDDLADESDVLAGKLAAERVRIAGMSAQIDDVHDEIPKLNAVLQAQIEQESAKLAAIEEAHRELVDAVTGLERLEQPLPAGTILPWMPGGRSIPPGWLLCDGSAGTPDLRGRFLRGAGSTFDAGNYRDSGAMAASGVHSHATDENRSIYFLSRSTPKSPGDWLLLFDFGINSQSPAELAKHGSHVHEDEHVPDHFTVMFIMKAGL